MGFAEIFLIGVGLSMDAFAVSICKGLGERRVRLGKALLVGAWFGVFQALMPIIGYYLGVTFKDYITAIDHWIAFVLLLFIGGKMIYDSFGLDKAENEIESDNSVKPLDMLIAAVATSIDALAVGVTFSFLDVSVFPAAGLIGVTTFVLSALGVKVGSLCGARFKHKAELVGGIILVLIGVKILLEHLGVISF